MNPIVTLKRSLVVAGAVLLLAVPVAQAQVLTAGPAFTAPAQSPDTVQFSAGALRGSHPVFQGTTGKSLQLTNLVIGGALAALAISAMYLTITWKPTKNTSKVGSHVPQS
jgi:hypothetical protein